jgi:hypothetical protein
MKDVILNHLSSLPKTPENNLLRRRYILSLQKKLSKRNAKPITLTNYLNSTIPRVFPLCNTHSCPTGLIPLEHRCPDLVIGTRAKYTLIKYISETSYENSLSSRIHGNGPKLDRVSNWTGKLLHPYIWRNTKAVDTPRMKLLAQIIDHRYPHIS